MSYVDVLRAVTQGCESHQSADIWSVSFLFQLKKKLFCFIQTFSKAQAKQTFKFVFSSLVCMSE